MASFDKITFYRKEAQKKLRLITMFTYFNIISLMLNLFYILWVLYISTQNIDYIANSPEGNANKLDYQLYYLVINAVNLCGLLSNFVGILRSNSKFIVFYFYTNTAWAWLSFFYLLFLISLAIPCADPDEDTTFLQCFKTGAMACILLFYNCSVMTIIYINFKKLVKANKVIRRECEKLVAEALPNTDLSSIKLGPNSSLASELKNELTAAEFAEHLKRLKNPEISLGSVRTIASDEPIAQPKPVVY